MMPEPIRGGEKVPEPIPPPPGEPVGPPKEGLPKEK